MATTISDKLEKVNDHYSVNMYDNGFMLEISGRDHLGEWANAKILANNVDELIALIQEAASLPRE
jgi:hypothetical protein